MVKLLSIAAFAAVAALAAAGPANAQSGCSHETLQVRGTSLAIAFCPAGAPRSMPGSEIAVPVQANYSAAGGSFQESPTLLFVASDGPSRVIRNLDLTRVGMSGTLHLTLVYAANQVRVESAMLTPGAIIVK
ncbi:MAG: hypothetical protein ACLQPV_01410 [Vulcanimicrobiaceae bacterium]